MYSFKKQTCSTEDGLSCLQHECVTTGCDSLPVPHVSTDQSRSASSRPASSARLFPPRPQCGCRAAWRWGSQGRRARPAKPLTPVSAAPLSTCEEQKICLNCLYSLPSSLLSSLLSLVHHSASPRTPEIFDLDFLQKY